MRVSRWFVLFAVLVLLSAACSEEIPTGDVPGNAATSSGSSGGDATGSGGNASSGGSSGGSSGSASSSGGPTIGSGSTGGPGQPDAGGDGGQPDASNDAGDLDAGSGDAGDLDAGNDDASDAATLAVNAAPTLQFLPCPAVASSTVIATVHLQSVGNQAGDTFAFTLADADVAPDDLMSFHVVLEGAEGHAALMFGPPLPEGVEVVRDQREFRQTATRDAMDQALRSMEIVTYGAAVVDATLRVTVTDNGRNGACSAQDQAPCAKQATAVIQLQVDPSAPQRACLP